MSKIQNFTTTTEGPISPYEQLANYVVIQAVKDYRCVLRGLKTRDANGKYNAPTPALKKDCEKFFTSKHFTIFTAIDGPTLMHRLQDEVR